MEQGLLEKTGKTLQQWKTILAAQPVSKHGEIMAFLKGECGLTHGYANFIALKFRGADAASTNADELIAQQYQGKETLMPIYQKLHQYISQLADDVDVSAKKSAVSFRRKRQFALVQPSTKTRIDLGLKFNDRAISGRLEGSGPFGTMCSHRVQLTDITQVDSELFALIKAAYVEAG
ncbi:MAG: DUF4287 domain-containing protein [Paraglaciecola sp.]|uniref:DUF5655 domain-containing protein n=1 Tax=Pseudomonadati TaxID=3379134 RepID=UPI00273D1151|nr:DUF5655 domain-containing protein [Paraglaciecola sp.]MDP5030020.1 DUF4287 domain-containing protein [Paraglaciecola sp.]MDP5130866.1 DUF4287 domain-containing protein [Paraglaciecola sp.]